MGLRATVRELGRRFAPGLMADRARRYESSIRESGGVPDAVKRDVAEHGDVVRSGALKGMRYPLDLLLEAHMPLAKIAGVYERELDGYLVDSLEMLRSRPLFVDLGSSDGYYAAGIGHASGAAVVAFDIAPSARRATQALCRANQVDCDCRSTATTAALRELGPSAGLILCDIEGAEKDVFSETSAGYLANTRLIIETHEPLVAGVEQTLIERFADTHTRQTVELIPDEDWRPGFSEARTDGIRWFVFDPIHK